MNKLYIPEVLVDSLVRWSDIQSISYRMSEADISFKSGMAKRYLALAITLYRMMRFVHDPTRLLTLPKMLMQPPPTILFSKKDHKIDIFQVGSNKINILLSSSSPLSQSQPNLLTTTTTSSSSSLQIPTSLSGTINGLGSPLRTSFSAPSLTTTSATALQLLQQNSQMSNISLDDLCLDEGVLQQMLYDGIQQSNVDTLDEEDSLNEFGGITNDHDTETELPADGGTYVGSDDDDDDT